jgi:CPA2 family monovalent cation:H+ antiporter-2
VLETAFFRDVALVALAALAGGAIATWLRQPLFVGYVIGGLLVNPFTPGPSVQDVATFQLFAQIGVILLMFSIGVELELRDLKRTGPPALVGAPVMAALTIGTAMAVGAALRWPLEQAAAVGIVIANSSSMVAAKLLLEHGELHAPHGHVVLSTTLMEDLLTVILIVTLPVLALGEAARVTAAGAAILRAAAILVPFLFLANRVIPPILTRVASRKNTELFVIVAIAIAVGTAALSSGLGLSLALGAFLAGIVISESEFTHEILTRILPMRDLFGALFFVSVGALIRPADVLAAPSLLLLMTGLILIGKFLLRVLTLRLFRFPLNMAALVSVHLAQTGEFTFVMAQVGLIAGVLTQPLYQAILAASLISILVISFLSGVAHRWIEQPPPPAGPADEVAQAARGHVLVCGFGRVGGTVGEALETFGIPFTVVDLDFAVGRALRARGVPCVYGDAASEPVLRRAGAASARLAVVAIADFERTRLTVRRLREITATLSILARSTHTEQRAPLLEAGATEVIQPEFEAAQTLIRHSLQRLDVPFADIRTYMLEQRRLEFSPGEFTPQITTGHTLQTGVVRVGSGAWADTSLRRARVRERTGVSVLAIHRADGAQVVNPGPDAVPRPGDEVVIMGLPEQLALFVRLNQEPP